MRHVYVHVPFCARRCVYCDFAIAVRRAVPSERFVETVAKELELRQAAEAWSAEPLETIYLGGGTPSRLAADSIGRLLDVVRAAAPRMAQGAEITLEANPDDVTIESARAWAAAGINRISLGIQSFQANVLAWMHREHSSEDAARAVDVARDAGFTNLSLDLIFGLPDEVGHEFAADLERVAAIDPEHVSVYGLTIEPGTPLEKRHRRGVSVAAAEPAYESEFLAADRVFTAAGFEHYEVSNYAKPERRAAHNSAYWHRRPYVGLGPSAHSYLGDVRRWNEREWVAYDHAVREGRDPRAGSETLTAGQRAVEDLMLGLRTTDGVAAPMITQTATLDEVIASGWVVTAGDRVRLTPAGWIRLESILARLTT